MKGETQFWFTADTHFGHVNIVRYCGRPFETIEVHDETLIERWNARVAPGDVVYHLGDFGLPQGFEDHIGYLRSIKARLNGQVHLVLGNHDKRDRKFYEEMFVTVEKYNTAKVRDKEMGTRQLIVLCHYPFETWDRSGHGSWHLHGHSHGNLKTGDDKARLDVGVDVHGFAPLSYDEIKAHMATKTFKPVDHHGRR